MGLYDTALAKCKCGLFVEFQSKAGACQLKSYNVLDLPAVIAEDLAGESRTCNNCHAIITLRLPNPIPRVAMVVTGDDDYPPVFD